jgi:hypothetical protein
MCSSGAGCARLARWQVNTEAGLLAPQLGRAIQQAAGEAASGALAEQFPLLIWCASTDAWHGVMLRRGAGAQGLAVHRSVRHRRARGSWPASSHGARAAGRRAVARSPT